MSRSRQLRPLPDDLPAATMALLRELRSLKDRSGLDLRALERRTYASRSSWCRWLSGETRIPVEAVETMAELCGGDVRRLRSLWHRADDDRRHRSPAAEGDTPGAVALAAAGPAGLEPADPAPPAASPAELRPGDPAPAAEGPAGADPAGAGSAGAPGGVRRRALFVAATAGSALVAATIGLAVGASLRPAAPAPPRPAHTYAQWVSRTEIMARVMAWHPHGAHRVAYSQSATFQGYRTDGSGYASMALGLPEPGPNSTDLAWGGYCRRITPARLRPGDLIINASGPATTRQVAIFDRWANAAHAAYWVYQQRRGYGTDHLVLAYPLAPHSPYQPYRPLNINEHPPG